MTARFFLVACLMCAQQLQAQESGLAFLTIGTDAAAVARADASVAGSHGAFSTFWNPAALSRAGRNEVALSHHIWIDGLRTYALASRFSVGSSAGIGLFITGTDSGELEERDQPGPPSGTFEAQYLNFGTSLGLDVGPLRVGASVKYITEHIYNDVARGYGIDLGLHADFLNESVLVGASLQNLGEMSELRTTATRLPRTVRMGTQVFPFRIVNSQDGTSLMDFAVSVDFSRNTVDEISRLHFGAEGRVLDLLIVRAGYMTNDTLRGVSTGLGLELSDFAFDYAMVPFKSGFDGPAHIFGFAYSY